MAIMIPETLSLDDYDALSKENLIWNSLAKNLSNDYYVFHSKKISYQHYNDFTFKTINKEAESDFIVINKNLGILVIEAKYLHSMKIENGKWYTNEGIPIHHGYGPYEQAKNIVNIFKSFLNDNIPSLRKNLPITYVVWFHGISRSNLGEFKCIDDMNLAHTFSSDDLEDPSKKIKKLLEQTAVLENTPLNISDADFNKFKKIMNIENNIIDCSQNLKDQDVHFARLLDEQIRILDFLEGQDCACIQGLGGTGKTVIAIEKAKRCAMRNEKTLFLCYNIALQNHLKEKYKDYGIDFYTLDLFSSLSRKEMGKIGTINSSYSDIVDYALSGEFPYKNIIIDEGQDFTVSSDNPMVSLKIINDVFDAFKLVTEEKEGCLYIFFDKYQCVQSNENLLPDIINKPDCLITLRTNCRNTLDIAKTSFGPLSSAYQCNKRFKILKGIESIQPNCYVLDNSDNLTSSIDKELSIFKNNGLKNIVILTLKNIKDTCLSKDHLEFEGCDCYYRFENKRYMFTTVRKFKGLEAEGVILIDVDENTFSKKHDNDFDDGLSLFYVGASRASRMLSIISVINSKENLAKVLEESHNQVAVKRPITNLVKNLLLAKLKK